MTFYSELKKMSKKNDRSIYNKTEFLTVIRNDNIYSIDYTDMDKTEDGEFKRCNVMLKYNITKTK